MQDAIVALITPFTKNGAIDFSALTDLIRWHVEEGSDGLVLCGSTGEGALLSTEEKRAVFQKAIEVGKGKIRLIGATGSCGTRESISLTKEAKDLGLDGALIIVPYNVKPMDRGVIEHFREVAKEGLPLIVYHHPGRTGKRLSIDVLEEICRLEEVIAVKDSSGDLELAAQIVERCDADLLSGDDIHTRAHLQLGAKGCVSVIGNVAPRAWKEGQDLPELLEALQLETNPICIKYAVSLLGKCLPNMRLPLTLPEAKTRDIIAQSLTAESVWR